MISNNSHGPSGHVPRVADSPGVAPRPGADTRPGQAELDRFNWAFALSGGGAQGAYTAGVIEAFRRRGLFASPGNVRIVHGVSTGALVATLVALGEFGELGAIYRRVVTSDVLAPSHRLLYRLAGDDILPVIAACAVGGPPYVFSTAPLRRLIADVMGENDQRFAELIDRRDRVDVGYTVVDFSTGRVRYVSNQDEGITPVQLRQALLASTNQPVLMDMVPLGPDRHLHCDGGIRETLPFDRIHSSPHAGELDVIVSVMLDPPEPLERQSDWTRIGDILRRTVELLGHSIGKDDLDRATLTDALFRARHTIVTRLGDQAWAELEHDLPDDARSSVREMLGPMARACEIIRIQPHRLEFRDPLQFDPVEMRRAWDDAIADTDAALDQWWAARGQRLKPGRGNGSVPWPHTQRLPAGNEDVDHA